MFFVAFFLQAKVHRVIPHWIRGINYEDMINNGINRNLKFLAFYSDNQNVFDEHGVPLRSHVPDPNAQGVVFPNDGWYLCQVRKFKGGKLIFDIFS